MGKVELTPLEWIAKVNEYLTLAMRNMKNGIDLQEHHRETIRALHSVYFDGGLILYKKETQTTNDIISQGMLFSSDNAAATNNGTDVDNND